MENLIKNKQFKWLTHTFICALFWIVGFTLSDFIKTPVASFTDVVMVATHMTTILLASWTLITLLSTLPTIVFTILYAFITLLASILAFYRYTMGFSLNTMILDIVFQNDIAISADMVTWEVIVWVCFATLCGTLLALLRRLYTIDWHSKWTYFILVVSVCGLIIFLNPNGRFARPISERIPFNLYAVTKKHFEEKQEISKERPRCFKVATTSVDSLTVVVVIGEALRPQNMSINGYERSTTPNLERLGAISYDNVYSEYVYTNRSVPHILTRADSVNIQYAYTERSFIDVFKAAGYFTTFIANQDAEKSYVYFMNEADTCFRANTSKTVYNFEKWLDEDMLPYYISTINDNSPRQLILLHCIGSHWWYNSHYSDDYKIYTPVITSRILSNCDSMAMVNSYDNTVCYTDFFLSQIIEPLQNRNAVVIFLSDHGEALGENGKWLHASESEAMHSTAAFVWFSPLYAKQFPQFVEQAENNRHKKWRTDFLYHSVIDAGHITTDVMDTTLSIFR